MLRRERRQVRAVVTQFVDRIAHVAERGVRRLLAHAGQHLRRPAPREFLERADVEVAVVEMLFQPRHQPMQEAAILADRVAAHRRSIRRHPFGQERHRACLGIGQADALLPARAATVPTCRAACGSIRPSLPAPHSGCAIASSGPSARMLSCESVTIVAISRIASRSVSSPVISRSIQIRRPSSLGTVLAAMCSRS